MLDTALTHQANSPAVIADSGTLSYRELDAAATAAAGALWSRGIRPGDRVAACLPNDLDIIAAFHGAQRIGAVWVGIGEALTETEQQRLVEHCLPGVILGGPAVKLDDAHLIPLPRWRALLADSPAAPPVPVDVHAPAGIAYTSGTTGSPKGIVHSQHNLLLPGAVLVASRGWGPGLRKGDCLPLTILNMLVLTTLLTAQARGCCLVTGRRDTEGVAEWIERDGVEVWNGAPAQLFDLARRPGLNLASLTEVWSGGSDCSDELRAAFHSAHGLSIRATYGLTEAPTVVAIDPVGDGWRSGTSGKVLPHLQVDGVGADGIPVSRSAEGEIRIRAAISGSWPGEWTPMLGYWEDGRVRPGPADHVMTGDIGNVDADGWLRIVGRKKIVIVRGGANVYPAEVERVLTACPGVAAAAVFGVRDDRLGERVAVLLEPVGDGVDMAVLRETCRQQLARYKVPEIWQTIPRLPVNAMGKVVRTGLTDLLTAATAGDTRE